MRRAGLQMVVHHHAALTGQPRRLRQRQVSAKTNGTQHHIGSQRMAVGQRDFKRGSVTLICFVHRSDRAAQVPVHTQPTEGRFELRTGLRGQQRSHGPVCGVGHADRQARPCQIVGKFTANQPRAHDHDALGFCVVLGDEPGVQGGEIAQRVHRQHVVCSITGQWHANRLCTGGEHQLAVTVLARIGAHRSSLRVNSGNAGVGQERDVLGGGHFCRLGAHQLGGGTALGKRVRQGRLGVEVAAVSGDHEHRSGGVEFAKLACHGPTRQTGTNDDQGKRSDGVHAQTSTTSKSALATPQSGHSQLSGTSAHSVPGAKPSSGRPAASS